MFSVGGQASLEIEDNQLDDCPLIVVVFFVLFFSPLSITSLYLTHFDGALLASEIISRTIL